MARRTSEQGAKAASIVAKVKRSGKIEQEHEADWIKVDLHIHTLEDPKDRLDYSAHELLERARELGFGALAITLHDKVFDRPEIFARAAAMGILLIQAAEMRLEGADVVLLNVQPNEVENLRTFAELRQLRARRGESLFCFAPHPFFFLGASIGERLLAELDCFDAIEICHFHKGLFDLNRRARQIAAVYGKPLLATSDAHRLEAFGAHYTSIPRPAELSVEAVLRSLREGPLSLTSPGSSWHDLLSVFYFVFIKHPLRKRLGFGSPQSCADEAGLVARL
jgi:predicted metal-dependent phosphoesterase TrpH